MQLSPQPLLAIPREWFRQMRATSPVYRNERPPFDWSIFCYAEALQVLTQPEIFSSAPAPGSMQPALPSILGMDDPRHRTLRSIVSRAFTPRLVADLAPRISTVVNDLLDEALSNSSQVGPSKQSTVSSPMESNISGSSVDRPRQVHKNRPELFPFRTGPYRGPTSCELSPMFQNQEKTHDREFALRKRAASAGSGRLQPGTPSSCNGAPPATS